MVHGPDIILLDEPTAGVDPYARRQFWEAIYQQAGMGRTIFVTTHYMDEAEYCDRKSIMVAGKIESIGTPDPLKEKFGSPTMEDVLLKVAR